MVPLNDKESQAKSNFYNYLIAKLQQLDLL